MDAVIYLAGGCFWGLEELLRTQHYVFSTEVGYTGGHTQNPTYKDVCTGTTGHAESVKVIFKKENLADLLIQFFSTHDPTTENRQGNDIGTQYRSAIFCTDAEQKKTVASYIQKLNELNCFGKPVATKAVDATAFYSAEDYHQKYLLKNPNGYTCHYFRQGLKLPTVD